MARKQEAGLRYFPLDCRFFRDDEIMLLQSRHGSAGVCIYLYVLCKVYEDEGYYMKWRGDDSVRLIARALELKAGTVRGVISYLTGSSLLTRIDIPGDGTRPGPITVITSAGIQAQYQKSTEDKGRKVPVTVDANIWLLRADETAPHIQVTLFSDKSGINSYKSGINPNKSGINPVNEIKVNEIKGEGNNNESAHADHSSPAAIPRIDAIKNMALERIGAEAVDAFLAYIRDLEEREDRKVSMARVKGYLTQLVELSTDPEIRAEIARQSTIKHWNGFFPLSRRRSSHPAGAFANFAQRDYDYLDLERKLLEAQEDYADAPETWNKTLNAIFEAASPEERDAIDWERSRSCGAVCYYDGRMVEADEWHESHGAGITDIRRA